MMKNLIVSILRGKPPENFNENEHRQIGRSILLGDKTIPIETNQPVERHHGAYYVPGKESLFYLVTQTRNEKNGKCYYQLEHVETRKTYSIPAELFNAIFVRKN